MILTVYKYSFNILIEEKSKSGNGGIAIFERLYCHIDVLEKIKVRMVVTPYLSGLITITEW